MAPLQCHSILSGLFFCIWAHSPVQVSVRIFSFQLFPFTFTYCYNFTFAVLFSHNLFHLIILKRSFVLQAACSAKPFFVFSITAAHVLVCSSTETHTDSFTPVCRSIGSLVRLTIHSLMLFSSFLCFSTIFDYSNFDSFTDLTATFSFHSI